MKTKNTLLIILFSSIILIPQIGWTQDNKVNENKKNTVATANEELWKPINKFPDPNVSTVNDATPLINVLNGVSFYSKNSSCNGEKVTILKLINSNAYPVRVEWQMTTNGTVEFVDVPASRSIDGSCSSTNSNESKLALKEPNETERETIKNYVYSHIKITKQ